MSDRGRGRGRGDFQGRGRGGGRGEYGGRGDFGGRGEGRGRFGGERGRGRDGGGFRGGRGGGGGRGFSGGGPQLAPLGQEGNPGTAAKPQKSVTLPSEDASDPIAKRLRNGQDKELARPDRPGLGKAGVPTQVRANHFPVKISLKEAYHYDVTITEVRELRAGREAGELPPIVMRGVLAQLASEEGWSRHGVYAYDGKKNLYSPTRLFPQTSEHKVNFKEDGKRKDRIFNITINLAATIDIAALLQFVSGQIKEIPQSALQALDTALNQSAAQNALCTQVARASFWQSSNPVPIGDGAEIWFGYKQSLRPCQNGLTLNMDMATTAFLQADPMVTFLQNTLRRPIHELTLTNPADLKKAHKAMDRLKFTTSHTGYKKSHKFKRLVPPNGPKGVTFQNEAEQREMSVAEYFQSKYNIGLKYPGHPVIDVGSKGKPNYLPLELCTLSPGQRQLKLSPQQTMKMIGETAVYPGVRSQRINESLQQKAALHTDATAQGFGIEVSKDMVMVPGRILPIPALTYSQEFRPAKGDWNLSKLKFFQASQLRSYGLASFAREDPMWAQNGVGFEGFTTELMKSLRSVGLTTPDPTQLPQVARHDGRVNFPGETLQAAAQYAEKCFGRPAQIIFVLLPDNSLTNAYNDVKRASDSFLGIPTQCLALNKSGIGRPDGKQVQYRANVAMKVNAKLQGTNCVVPRRLMPKFTARPYIIFGADVTHSRSYDKSEPSVAAVVASMDPNASTYACEVKMQGHRQEMIQDLKGMVKSLLIQFYKSSGAQRLKPERIIFYRDGVSEGQFPIVQNFEIPQVVAACQELGRSSNEDYSPPITFLVAQKRHNTRFFPVKDGDKNGNPRAGLVVDSKVVHPSEFSFFLNSHEGLKGTSRSCHYHVLMDQNKLSADELQQFTYNLCYIFCRCSKAVSMASPAYYAHLAAKRGRIMYTPSTTSDSESMASSDPQAASRINVDFADIHKNLKPVMFYV